MRAGKPSAPGAGRSPWSAGIPGGLKATALRASASPPALTPPACVAKVEEVSGTRTQPLISDGSSGTPTHPATARCARVCRLFWAQLWVASGTNVHSIEVARDASRHAPGTLLTRLVTSVAGSGMRSMCPPRRFCHRHNSVTGDTGRDGIDELRGGLRLAGPPGRIERRPSPRTSTAPRYDGLGRPSRRVATRRAGLGGHRRRGRRRNGAREGSRPAESTRNE